MYLMIEEKRNSSLVVNHRRGPCDQKALDQT